MRTSIVMTLLILSFSFGMIVGTQLPRIKYSGTVQECFDKGGDTYYANKNRNTASCSIDSKNIE